MLQLTAVFWQSDTFGGNSYFADDGTYFFICIILILFSSCVNHTYKFSSRVFQKV